MKESILPYLPSGFKWELPSIPRPKKKKRGESKIKMGRGPGDVYSNGPGAVTGDGAGDGGGGNGGGMGESIEKKDFTYAFSCAMLNLTEETAAIFKYWAKKMIPPENLFINLEKGIEGYEYLPHVTIKYGLHDETPEKIIKLATGYGPIQLNFDKVTKFIINPEFDVLKVDVISEKLNKLNKLVCDNMEHTDTFDSYIPHITLAYIKKNTCNELENNDFFNKLSDFVNEIYFTSKNGEDYFIRL